MPARHITVYTPAHSNRLQYVLHWLLKEQLRLSYTLVHDIAAIPARGFCLAYGTTLPGAVTIPDASLLWQNNIGQLQVTTGIWQNVPTLFAIDDNEYTLPFDLFSAIFFLLSRYEEYLLHIPDKYERYPATDSILYKNNWLRRPLIDEWLLQLRLLLEQHGVEVLAPDFGYQPTYDIDIAYSYRHKGVKRNLGGLFKDILKGRRKLVQTRLYVLAGKEQDPYDCFVRLRQLHADTHFTPVYFILAALQTTGYDKNVNPHSPAMRHLVAGLAAEGYVGMHPSYFSNNNELFIAEKKELESMVKKEVRLSRQHYIRLQLPDTYRRLLQHGITQDFSMGYGTHLGFRAATALPFPWYDLQAESVTSLRIYPFCFMDTTALYEEKMSVAQAFTVLGEMKEVLQQTGSPLITVFHNFSLGSSDEWAGWYNAYAAFLQSLSTATSV